MFGKLFRRARRPAGAQSQQEFSQRGEGGDGLRARDEASDILRTLDRAIKSIHPERYGDPLEAAADMRGYLINLNVFLGRPQTERLLPIEFDAILQRLEVFAGGALLASVLEASKPLVVLDALMQGAMHEYKLRKSSAPHDAINLGREVRILTVGLIHFLNRVAIPRASNTP